MKRSLVTGLSVVWVTFIGGYSECSAQGEFHLQKIDKDYFHVYHGSRQVGMANYVASSNADRAPCWDFMGQEDSRYFSGTWYLDDNTVVERKVVLGEAQTLAMALQILVKQWYELEEHEESGVSSDEHGSQAWITLQITDENGFEIPDAYGIVTWYFDANAQGYFASDEFRTSSTGVARLPLRSYQYLSISVWSRSGTYFPHQTERVQAHERRYTITMRKLN